jgi:hypothetical protein
MNSSEWAAKCIESIKSNKGHILYAYKKQAGLERPRPLLNIRYFFLPEHTLGVDTSIEWVSDMPRLCRHMRAKIRERHLEHALMLLDLVDNETHLVCAMAFNLIESEWNAAANDFTTREIPLTKFSDIDSVLRETGVSSIGRNKEFVHFFMNEFYHAKINDIYMWPLKLDDTHSMQNTKPQDGLGATTGEGWGDGVTTRRLELR